MFLRTVMCGQSAYDWNTMPMLRLSGGRLSLDVESNTLRPPNELHPELGVSKPARHRSVVVLPQPLGPRRTTNSPSSISRSRSSIAVVGGRPANRLLRPSILT